MGAVPDGAERAPSGEEWLKTLITLSERHDAWSQEQGLRLFLLIDRLVPGWQARFLAPDFPSPFTVLRTLAGAHHWTAPLQTAEEA